MLQQSAAGIIQRLEFDVILGLGCVFRVNDPPITLWHLGKLGINIENKPVGE